MPFKQLSRREEEIVLLCIEGLTNEAIALRLGLAMGTLNTYWVRIKLKVGGQGRADTVARIIKEQAERNLKVAEEEKAQLAEKAALLAEAAAGKEVCEDDYRSALALLDLATNIIESTAWATDLDLTVDIVTNMPPGMTWEAGQTVYEFFQTTDPEHLAIAAHLSALQGEEVEVRLDGKFADMVLRVHPLTDDADHVLGCLGILTAAADG